MRWRKLFFAICLLFGAGAAQAQVASENSTKRTFLCRGNESGVAYSFAFQFRTQALQLPRCTEAFRLLSERTYEQCSGTVLVSDQAGILDGQYDVVVTHVGTDTRQGEGGLPWIGYVQWGAHRVMPFEIRSASSPITFVTTWINASSQPHVVTGTCS